MTVYYFADNSPYDTQHLHVGDIGYSPNYSYFDADGHARTVMPNEGGPSGGDEVDGLGGTNGSRSVGLLNGASVGGTASVMAQSAQGSVTAYGGTIKISGNGQSVGAESGGTLTVSTVTRGAVAGSNGKVTADTIYGGVNASDGGKITVGTIVDGLTSENIVGYLNIQAGGIVNASSITTNGTDVVGDSVNGGTLTVGTYGSSNAEFDLTISNGGTATVSSIGASAFNIRISGGGSKLNGITSFTLGDAGIGSVFVSDGAIQSFTSVTLAANAGGSLGVGAGGEIDISGDVHNGVKGSGSITASGAGSLLKITGTLSSGEQSTALGGVYVYGGGTLQDDGAIAFGPGRTQSLIYDTGSTWKWNTGSVTVGNGFVAIGLYDGGLLDASAANVTFLGTPAGASLPSSAITIRGTKLNGSAGSTGTAKFKSLTIGGPGKGAVHAFAGGTIQVTGALRIGTLATGTAGGFGPSLDVNGADAKLRANTLVLGAETPNVDKYGVWSYTGQTFGSFGVFAGGYASIATSVMTNTSFTVSGGSGMEVGGNHGLGGASGPAADTLQIDAGGSIKGHGDFTVGTASVSSVVIATHPVAITTYSGTIANNGMVEIDKGTSFLNAGQINGSGTFQIDNQSALAVEGKVAAGTNFAFSNDSKYHTVLRLDDPFNFKGTISGFQAGDTIEISPIAVALQFGSAGTYDFTNDIMHTQIVGSNLVTTFTGDGTHQLTLALGGDLSGGVFAYRLTPGGFYALTYEPANPQAKTGSTAGGTPVAGTGYGNPYIDSLITGFAAWDASKGPITYWLGDSADQESAINEHGDTKYLTYNTQLHNWTTAEAIVVRNALADYAAVSGLIFAAAADAKSANIVFWKDVDVSNPNVGGTANAEAASETLSTERPDGHAWVYINDTIASWQNLSFGGEGNVTVVHELGHVLGLSHPFDGGRQTGRTRFDGVREGFATDLGSYGQNQDVYTVMSYNGGWNGTTPYPPLTALNRASGFQGALGAFDIAAIQKLYGTNGSHHSGNDVYTLPAANAAGTGWMAIWDTAGNDTLSNAGSNNNATIDLRTAPLTGPNAGGYVSYVQFVQGGFTIANGVSIENAVGGGGSDRLIGGVGTETFRGNGGDDLILGGAGTNTAIYSGVRTSYTITQSGNHITVSDGRSGTPDGTDSLYNVQFLQFSDQLVDLVAAGLESSAMIAFRPITGDDVLTATDTTGPVTIDGVSSGVVGRTVTVAFNGAQYTGVVQSDGTWSVSVPSSALTTAALADGTYTVTANVSNASGVAAPQATDALLVTRTAPHVTSITFSPTASPTTGQTVSVTVGWSAGVTVYVSNHTEGEGSTGTLAPTLALNNGGTATYDASHSTATSLVFNYTLAAGATAVASLKVTNIVLGTDVAIIGNSGNAADLSLTGVTQTGGTPPVNHAPVVTAANLTLTHAQTINGVTASSLFSATDSDGDTVVSYGLYDAGGGGGHLVLNGVTQASGTVLAYTAAQLAQLIYAAGSSVDTLYVSASDGSLSGGYTSFTVTPGANAAPVVTAANRTPTHGQTSIAASTLVSATDADSDPIKSYDFYDVGTGGGHLSLGGATQANGTILTYTAAQLSQLTYVPGSAADMLYVRASDGAAVGAFTSFMVTPGPNAAPTITAPNKTLAHGQTSVVASSLFTATDSDSDPIVSYDFYDVGMGGGHLALNGATQATGSILTYTAAQLSQLTYVPGSAVDTLYVRASDGTALGAFTSFNVTPGSNAAPVVTAANKTLTHAQTVGGVAVSSLFTTTDPESDTIASYNFYDAGAGGGHLSLNGVTQASGAILAYTAAQLSQLTYRAGNAVDTLYIAASDGSAMGGYTSFTVTPGSNAAPVVTVSNRTLTHAQTVSGVAASSLTTATDADSDPILSYDFYDVGYGRRASRAERRDAGERLRS